MPQRPHVHVATAYLLFALACQPPPEYVEDVHIIAVTSPIVVANRAAPFEITWAIPDVPGLVSVEAAVTAEDVDVVYECEVWAGALLGPRARGASVLQVSADVGVIDLVPLPLTTAQGLENRRDRLVSCGASGDADFWGLRVFQRRTIELDSQ